MLFFPTFRTRHKVSSVYTIAQCWPQGLDLICPKAGIKSQYLMNLGILQGYPTPSMLTKVHRPRHRIPYTPTRLSHPNPIWGTQPPQDGPIAPKEIYKKKELAAYVVLIEFVPSSYGVTYSTSQVWVPTRSSNKLALLAYLWISCQSPHLNMQPMP